MAIDFSDVILNDDELERLKVRMDRLGEVRTAENLRISRMALLRLVARRPVRLGTISLARIGLAKAV
jgi:hypothetical protein